jgi:hypothetical protein
MNKETDLLDVYYFIRGCDIKDIRCIVRKLETRRLELQGSKHLQMKLKHTRNYFKNRILVENANVIYGESIVDKLIKEGFIFKKDNRFIVIGER